jgi:hypothetical protein
MNTETKLSKMKQKLIEAEENCIFYCNNCKNEFDHVIEFNPVPGLKSYYNCTFCNSILPINDLKQKNKNNYSCCCC